MTTVTETRTSNAVLRIAKTYLIMIFPIVLVLLAARLVMTPLFLQYEYNRADFPTDEFGFTREDRLNYAPYALNYLLNGAGVEYLGDLKDANGGLLYEADELRHMRDVKALAQIAFGVAFLAGVLGIADGVFLFRRSRASLRGGLFYGAVVTLALVVAIVVVALVDWEGFFVGFHELFFKNGTWYFPTSDTLIRLFPEQFWFDAALAIGGITVGTSLLTIGISRRIKNT
ncbi:MAG: TIGR01906 family membrane protein [Chloroflexota bacterium]